MSTISRDREVKNACAPSGNIAEERTVMEDSTWKKILLERKSELVRELKQLEDNFEAFQETVTYDGSSTWESYELFLEALADYGGWDIERYYYYLVAVLRGEAVYCLEDVPETSVEEQKEFLVKELVERFGKHLLERSRWFWSDSFEDLQSVQQNDEHLANLAYSLQEMTHMRKDIMRIEAALRGEIRVVVETVLRENLSEEMTLMSYDVKRNILILWKLIDSVEPPRKPRRRRKPVNQNEKLVTELSENNESCSEDLKDVSPKVKEIQEEKPNGSVMEEEERIANDSEKNKSSEPDSDLEKQSSSIEEKQEEQVQSTEVERVEIYQDKEPLESALMEDTECQEECVPEEVCKLTKLCMSDEVPVPVENLPAKGEALISPGEEDFRSMDSRKHSKGARLRKRVRGSRKGLQKRVLRNGRRSKITSKTWPTTVKFSTVVRKEKLIEVMCCGFNAAEWLRPRGRLMIVRPPPDTAGHETPDPGGGSQLFYA